MEKYYTEPPFTGEYWNFKGEGIYLCANCGEPLFSSEAKFDSGSGWPSFDEDVFGAAAQRSDPDGKRTEIFCAVCESHLGHFFEGERFTEKNARYCVNSYALRFVSREEAANFDWAFFAGGCFWGVESLIKKRFADGIISTTVGYMGGGKENPTYEEVCSGTTGHLETVKTTFDKRKVDYEELAKYFFEIHDFEQTNGQGPDIGEQYRSAIFFANESQKKIAERLIEELRKKGYKPATILRKAEKFWRAESYHQDYYQKTGGLPYCHIHRKKF